MSAERFPVEAGHIMMFARSVGDDNPVYHDAVAAARSEVGGVIAPPTFTMASAQYDPDYPLRPRADRVWFGSGRTASGLMAPPEPAPAPAGDTAPGASGSGGSGGGGTGLHAEQHFEYHRPLRAGEVLSVATRPGATWEKQGRRGGQLTFAESVTEFRGADGELVVTARMVGVRTGQTVKEA